MYVFLFMHKLETRGGAADLCRQMRQKLPKMPIYHTNIRDNVEGMYIYTHT